MSAFRFFASFVTYLAWIYCITLPIFGDAIGSQDQATHEEQDAITLHSSQKADL